MAQEQREKSVGLKELLKKLEEKGSDLFSAADVLCAYLYGSHARGESLPQSDMDIAVLVKKDFPERDCLNLELNLSLELDKLGLGAEAEVRVINRLPLLMRGEILTEGHLIYCRDDSARVEFETSTRDEYFDFLPVHQAYQKAYFSRE
jgi:hypothetical protein